MILKNIFFILCTTLAFSIASQAELEPCGKVIFDPKMTCENPQIQFDVTACDPGVKKIHPAAKSACEGDELVSIIKLNNMNYRAVFVKGYNGAWSQRGQVWRSGKEPKVTTVKDTKKEDAKPAIGVATPAVVATSTVAVEKPKRKKKQNQEVKPTSTPAPAVAMAASSTAQPVVAAAAETPAAASAAVNIPWKFNFAGWVFVEHESVKNIGDGLTQLFDSNDPKSQQSDTNLLSNFQFTAQKQSITFDSLLEVGEVFFGDTSAANGGGDSGGAQGLRGKIIEVRNLNLQEEFSPNWFFKVGLLSINADPRGFILSDHHAGAQIRLDKELSSSQIWFADATKSKPGTTVRGDTYVGLSHNQKYGENNYTAFATYRSTRDTFVDTDLVTNVEGQSTYLWVGANNVMKNIIGLTQFEVNAIIDQAQFKGNDGGPTDNNTGWLAHVHLDKDVEGGFNFGFDALGTSGSNDGRTGGVQILGRRKNFASPDPGHSYLLTVVSSDGADDAPGSVRGTNPGKIDLDEGIRIFVVTANKTFGEKWETFLRYGQVMSGVANSATDSSDYGHEVDLHLKYKSTANTSWFLDYGLFTPGKYFAQRDEASLTSLRYRLDF